MQLTITSTDQLTVLNGVPCRVWHGLTAEAVPCFVFVQLIAAQDPHDMHAFEQALQEMPPPRTMLQKQVLANGHQITTTPQSTSPAVVEEPAP